MALFLLAPGCTETPRQQDGTNTSSDEGGSEGSTGHDADPSESTADASESTAGASESTTGESTGEPIDPSTTTTADASTDASSDGSTGVGSVCGDGVVDGDEVCDDGINDDSYGGCASDCSALGPHCGDGDVNGEEMCDEGVANENGHGCNVDCVVSGTLLATYEVSLCGRAIESAVREDGNVLLAYGGCDQVWELRELSPDLVEVASTTATFSAEPTQSIERGTDWILGAWECDTVVADDGSVTEVCAGGRISGYDALEAVDDETYVTMLDGVVAQWGGGSPSDGDAPEWTATVPPAEDGESYSFATVTPGSEGSVVAAGLYGWYDATGSHAAAYLRVFDADGNPLTSRTYDELFAIEAIASTPSGALVASGWQSDTGANLMRIDENLDPSWAITTCPFGPRHFAVDSAEQIAVDCGSGSQLRKLDDNGEELWSNDLLGFESPDTPTYGGLVIDASDHIVRTTALYDPLVPEWRLRIERYAP